MKNLFAITLLSLMFAEASEASCVWGTNEAEEDYVHNKNIQIEPSDEDAFSSN